MSEKKNHNNFFLKYIKSRHQNIKFVFEEERNNKIAFLNISITGNELKMSYKYLYFKRTKLVVYTWNLNGHLPSEYKKKLLGKLSLQVKKQLIDIFRSYKKNINLTLYSSHPIKYAMLSVSKTSCTRVSTERSFVNIRAALAIVSTLVKLSIF